MVYFFLKNSSSLVPLLTVFSTIANVGHSESKYQRNHHTYYHTTTEQRVLRGQKSRGR